LGGEKSSSFFALIKGGVIRVSGPLIALEKGGNYCLGNMWFVAHLHTGGGGVLAIGGRLNQVP